MSLSASWTLPGISPRSASSAARGRTRRMGSRWTPRGISISPATTTSTDFPLHNPLQIVSYTAGVGVLAGTGFLMKLSADGTVLYSTYLGGTTGYSLLSGVAADSKGDAYVTGTTVAQDYPHTPGMPADGVSCCG